MPLALSKNSNRGTVGLDLDGAFIAAVQTSSDGVTRAASVELAPGVISDGEVTDVTALTDALRDFFKAEGLPKRVRLGIGNQQIVVRQMEIPKIDDDKERAAAVRFQASEAIAMPLDEVVLDHQVVGEGVSPEGSSRLRVVVVAARESNAKIDKTTSAAIRVQSDFTSQTVGGRIVAHSAHWRARCSVTQLSISVFSPPISPLTLRFDSSMRFPSFQTSSRPSEQTQSGKRFRRRMQKFMSMKQPATFVSVRSTITNISGRLRVRG